ncbi:MAG: hypothetical protein KHW49_02035 [Eubacterium sp.]|nr:hypothetical protein [Eubacterium sp.]
MKKNLYVIFVLISIVCIGTMWNNDCFGKETVEQKNSTDVIVDNFSGNMLNEKGIILKWSKVQKSKGYVIYRNSRKIATIKSNKIKKYTDKKVKSGKNYTYEIAPYRIINGEKVLGSKSYKIKVKATKRNTKKINPSKVVIPDFYYKENYSVGLNESIKLHAKAKVKKGLKKKKVFNSKIVWSSSDESLATVNPNGVVKANNNRKTGTVYITARAINGVKKVIKVDVTDYMKPLKFSKKIYIDETIRPVLTTYYKQLTEIAGYFSYVNKDVNAKFNLNEMYDGIESDSSINIPENIKKDIYDLMFNVSVEVEVKDNTLTISFDKLFADNSTFTYKINICLNEKPEYKYQYVIGYAKLCERWYYSEERNYNTDFYLKNK